MGNPVSVVLSKAAPNLHDLILQRVDEQPKPRYPTSYLHHLKPKLSLLTSGSKAMLYDMASIRPLAEQGAKAVLDHQKISCNQPVNRKTKHPSTTSIGMSGANRKWKHNLWVNGFSQKTKSNSESHEAEKPSLKSTQNGSYLTSNLVQCLAKTLNHR